MGALLEIACAFLIGIAGFTGVLGDFSQGSQLAYINNDTTRMQQAVEQLKQYCLNNQNGGNPCTDASNTALPTTGAIPQSLAGFWKFQAPEEKTGQQFTMNRTAATSCISVDDPASYRGQDLPANIPIVDATGALTTKAALTLYFLHADETMHGVYATSAATSTPGAC